MARRRTKKIVHKTAFLREEFFETKEIYDDAERDFFANIKTIQAELNVYDSDFDENYQPLAGEEKATDKNKLADDTSDESVPSESVINHPAWAKALYRKITVKTHPDKLLSEDSDEKERKVKIYNEAAVSYAEGDYVFLVMIAIDLKIAIPDNEEIIDILNKKCREYSKDTAGLKSSLFWIWYHSDESQKQEILRRFVKEKGWTNPRAAIKRSRPKKHPGQSVAWIRKKLADK